MMSISFQGAGQKAWVDQHKFITALLQVESSLKKYLCQIEKEKKKKVVKVVEGQGEDSGIQLTGLVPQQLLIGTVCMPAPPPPRTLYRRQMTPDVLTETGMLSGIFSCS